MGKTTVSNYLATRHQLPVLDADLYSRAAVEPGSPVLGEVVERYGSGLLQPDGTLDRHRLGEIIFSSPPERLWLEQQIHPHVRDRFVEAMNALSIKELPPVVVLVIPLLFEARMTDLVTETWVVRCPKEQQVERLMQRDRLSLPQVRARIESQMSIQKKASYADFVLDNTSTLEHLFQQVDTGLAQKPTRLAVPRG